MEEKKCIVCNEVKKVTEFNTEYHSNRKKYYTRNQCIKCRKKYIKENYNKNINLNRKKSLEYYHKNRESRILYSRNYKEKNYFDILKRQKKYRQKEEVKEKRRIRENKRRKQDFYWKLKCNLKRRLRESLNRKKYSKNCRTFDIIGISYDGYLKYIESKFYNNMNWHNKDKWHIDHIIPLKAAKTEFEVIALNHYTNLQPLWAKDNLTKKDSYNKEDFDNYMNWYVKNVRTKEEYNSLTL